MSKRNIVIIVQLLQHETCSAAYSNKKAAELAERQRREAEKAAAREAEKQKMIDIMEANFLAEKSAAEKRLTQSIRDAEDKQQVNSTSLQKLAWNQRRYTTQRKIPFHD